MALKFNMASWNVRNIKKVVLLDLNIIDNIAKRWAIGNHTFPLDLHKSRNLSEYLKNKNKNWKLQCRKYN